MRGTQHRDTLEFVKSLHEAQEEIRIALRRERYAEAQAMLAECQEFAAALGESIEKTEGAGHITVSRIEEYCESLYQAYQGISDGPVQENKIYRSLKQSLLKIKNSVKNDICVRREVVFFPYKAAMWDSLESIYLAARKDPNCDAYCVPVPYFDLKPDHSFGQMHYEGGEYPSGIEVTDWQKYRFEERKPDVIYIHNAYDNWNLVTSVHPRFYSENLKRYTDELVYVPYFVLGQINPADEKAAERIKHFCFLPGIVHADRVIVESEAVKKIYVREYLKAATTSGLGGKHLDREYVEEKIQVEESPKYKKVLNTRKEDIDIPDDWRNMLGHRGGRQKKVIFYNTSIQALLDNEEKMLDKIKEALEIFEGQKEYITLLWRPHPLLESTLEAMRPAMMPAYRNILDRYRTAGWGIYDNTADLNRAIALSDAYYGDNSSVVQLFIQAQKPVMLVGYG
ncbi:MAG: hypothetical protein HFG25_02795 [Lachnospiraceae bacterium]|nr:hypothetical protein [Lachnospiraceae bacterium]